MIDVFLPIAALVLGILLLTKGADLLVTGASALAYLFGVTPLVIGLTVVALGTSMPELATSLNGGSTIAVSNAAGSNLMNVGLILGITALIAPLYCGSKFIRFEMPVMVAAGPAFLLVAWDGIVSRIEGVLLCIALGVYIVISVKRGKQVQPEEVLAGAEEYIPKERISTLAAIGLLIAGFIGLLIGGWALVYGARELALLAGISERVVTLTIVAGGTSLPELATCVVAARKNQADLALGNIVGSNLFNILGIVGVCSVVVPQEAYADSVRFDIPAVIVIQILCIPIMLSRMKVSRIEGGVLLFSYALYIALLFLVYK